MAEQKAKVVKVGRGGPRGPRPKVQNPGKIFMRILRYVMECYRIQVVAVVICIFVSVFANVQGTLFMQTLIDGYILPQRRFSAMVPLNSSFFCSTMATLLRRISRS
jgi:ATP-binding cassette, subfamily B, multidrug efflux pump